MRLFLFLIILTISAAIRFYYLEYPVYTGESHRDYLAASHIIKYKEFPLTGPCCVWNSILGSIRHNGAYYYTTASILILKNNILFLSAVNIILQLLTISIVYFIAAKLFSHSTALIASILFSFNPQVLRQSFFYWQPHLMHPFFLMSALILLLAHLNKSYRLLHISVFLFIFSGALYPPVYAFLPIYIFLIYKILKNRSSKAIQYSTVFVSFPIVFISLYSSWFLYLFKNKIVTHQSKLFIQSFNDLIANLESEHSNLLEIVSLNVQKNLFSLENIVILFIVISFVLFIRKQLTIKSRNVYLLIIFAGISQFILMTLIFKTKVWVFHLTPIFGFLAMIAAEIVNRALNQKLHWQLIKAVVIVLIVSVYLMNFNSVYAKRLSDSKKIKEVFPAIENKTLEIQKNESYNNLDFFQIKFYSDNVESPQFSDLVFWSKLEEDFDKKFVKFSDSLATYKTLNSDEYVLLICKNGSSLERCWLSFRKDYPNNIIYEQIGHREPYFIYLSKKI